MHPSKLIELQDPIMKQHTTVHISLSPWLFWREYEKKKFQTQPHIWKNDELKARILPPLEENNKGYEMNTSYF